jgi:hypothetical protein
MPCNCDGFSTNEDFMEKALCRLCKFFKKETLQSYKPCNDLHQTLYDWYVAHLEKDVCRDVGICWSDAESYYAKSELERMRAN